MKKYDIKLQVPEQFNQKTFKEYIESFRVSHFFYNNLINKRQVKINGIIIKESTQQMNKNDEICITIEYKDIKPYKKDITIIYEDDYLLAVNKPRNILVHSDGNNYETLINCVNYYLSKNNKISYAYPIHRLDYETTGIVVFAKNPLTLAYLSYEIENNNVLKEYVCLCRGNFKSKSGVIDKPIGKDRHSNKQITSKTGKSARTFYEVIDENKNKVLVRINHGRKHQIRVHLSSINHPIYGDKLYGKNEKENLKLHFKCIEFIHPYTRKKIRISCEEDF